MAGDKIVVDDNCFCLCHLPWSFVQGNKNDMEKEIEALEKCRVAMMTYYMKHAKVSEEEIDKLLEDEVWLLGNEFADIFDVEVLACDEQMNIAAKFDLSKYKNIPQRILDMENISNTTDNTQHNEDTTPSPETTTQDMVVQDEVIDEKNDETPEDVSEKSETPDEEEKKPTYEELLARIAELEKQLDECQKKNGEDEDKVTKAECEKRVSGMQASMQK